MKRGYVIDYGSTSLLMATSGKLISNYIAPLLLCARLMIPSHQYIISFRKFFSNLAPSKHIDQFVSPPVNLFFFLRIKSPATC